jgi:hypothetical protein
MAEEKKDAEPTAADPILAGVEGIRKTAQWLIGAFAAIGAALIAGTQLSDIGSLGHQWGKLALAATGAAVGLGSAAIAIYQTMKVLLPTEDSMGEVAKDESKYPVGKLVASDASLLGPGQTIKSVFEQYTKLIKDYEDAFAEYESEKDKATPDPAKVDKLGEKVTEIQAKRDALGKKLQYVRKLALYTTVKERFKGASVYIVGGAISAGVGLVLFAYETNPPKDPTPRVPVLEAPTPVVATLTEVKADGLKAAIGAGCDLTKVQALAIAGSPKGGYDIVTLPAAACAPVRLSLPAASVSPAVTVKVDVPPPAKGAATTTPSLTTPPAPGKAPTKTSP